MSEAAEETGTLKGPTRGSEPEGKGALWGRADSDVGTPGRGACQLWCQVSCRVVKVRVWGHCVG